MARVLGYPGVWGAGGGGQAWLPARPCCPLTSPAFRERLSVARAAYLGHGC